MCCVIGLTNNRLQNNTRLAVHVTTCTLLFFNDAFEIKRVVYLFIYVVVLVFFLFRVSNLAAQRVVSSEAYLLFYELESHEARL